MIETGSAIEGRRRKEILTVRTPIVRPEARLRMARIATPVVTLRVDAEARGEGARAASRARESLGARHVVRPDEG